MKPTSSTTMSSVPVTSSHHSDADKNTQKTKSRNWQKGRVVPSKGILVNQGLKKIKLEEDFVPIKVEANVITEASSEDRDGDDMFTEEFTVTKEEVNSSVLPPEQPGQEGQSSSSYSCRDEVEALKKAVKQLTLQVKKQNEVVTKIKSSLRNAVLSVMTCCQDDEEEDEANRDEDGAGESAVIDVTSEPTSRSVSEEPLVIQNAESQVSKLSVAKCSDVPSVFLNKSFASLGTLTSEAAPHDLGQNTEHADMQSDNESSRRNAALSVMTCCQDDDEESEASRDGDGGGESPITDVNVTSEPTSRSVPEDSLLIQNAESQQCIDTTQEQGVPQNNSQGMNSNITIGKCSDVRSVFSNKPLASLETCTSEGGSRDLGQNSENVEMVDDKDFEAEEDKHPEEDDDKHSERGNNVDKEKESSYKCHFCNKVYKSHSSIYKHIQSAHEGVRYKCIKCPGIFNHLCSLQRHENQVHRVGGPPTQKCRICGVHVLKSSLALHIARVHKKSGSKSTRPQKSEPRLRKMEEAVGTRAAIFQCQHCLISFRRKDKLRCHIRQVHGIPSGKEADK